MSEIKGLRLITGGVASGKKEYLLSERYSWNDFKCSMNSKVVYKLNTIIRNLLLDKKMPLPFILENLRDDQVIVCDEVGKGVLPMDNFERAYQEQVGRICIEIAKLAETVENVYCGIPSVLKGQKLYKITLLRHAATAGNLRKAFIGVTDEPVFDDPEKNGCNALPRESLPDNPLVFSSPLRRCIETAAYFYPSSAVTVIDDLRECHFGLFEGKTYQELADSGEYDDWLNGSRDFPGGENINAFKFRCSKAFYEMLHIASNTPSRKNICNIVAVCHGGTIMSIMETLTGEDFYNWATPNAAAITFDFTGNKALNIQKS